MSNSLRKAAEDCIDRLTAWAEAEDIILKQVPVDKRSQAECENKRNNYLLLAHWLRRGLEETKTQEAHNDERLY